VSKLRKKSSDLFQLCVDGFCFIYLYIFVNPVILPRGFQIAFNLFVAIWILEPFLLSFNVWKFYLHLPSLTYMSRMLQNDYCRRNHPDLKPHNMPSFILKGSTEIFVLALKFIFNLSLSQNTFPSSWKQGAVVPVLKKCKHSFDGNCRHIAISNYSSVFEIIIHDHVSHFSFWI
jgi:hypothetical protein